MRKNKSICFSSSILIFAFHWTISFADSTNQESAPVYSANTNSSSSSTWPLPNFCPLGEPLRSSRGELILCNCPPRPFCPMLYYCKTEVHGQNGICCPDFGADRRYKVKPEDSRLPLYGSSPKSSNNEPCSPFGCMTASIGGNSGNSNNNNDNGESYKSVPSETKDTQTNKPVEEPENNCPPVQLSDIQPLPHANCVYEELPPGSDGCPRPPKIKCPTKPKVECKPVPIPLVAPGCTIGPEIYNENGCLQPIKVTCETTPAPTPSPSIYPSSPGSAPVVTEAPQPVIVPFAPGTDSFRVSGSVTRDYMAPTYAPSPPPCPTYTMPATLSPDCEIAPQRKDEFGCLLPPEIRCQKKATAYAPILQEKLAAESASNSNFSPEKNKDKSNYGIKTQCPQISMPKVQPGCKLLPSKYDANGCMLVPEITCDPSIINAKQCPVVTLPKMDPLCTFGPDRNDSQGCPMVPEIICPATPEPGPSTTVFIPEPATLEPHNIPRILSHCPYVAPPYLPPGCHYGTAKYDAHGCSIAPDLVCQPNVQYNNNNNVVGNDGKSAPQARRFSDMLTAEFYHIVRSVEAPDASSFRKSAAIPVVTAGKFHACRIHAECFHYREPREWCQTSSPQSQSVWTEKSCHCAEDTLVPACIVERMNRGIREWTFCADYAQCVQQ